MKTGFYGEYLDPKGMRMSSGEGFTMNSFLVCKVNVTYPGWLNAEKNNIHMKGI